MIERETVFYLGKYTGRHLVENRLASVGIKAPAWQIDEIVRRMKSMQESADKGGTQMTFYQVKKLMRELRKGFTEEDFWKIVEQVTKQKPKIKQGTTSPS
jgi:isopropylmalate/homocitrate/citramalate synthase